MTISNECLKLSVNELPDCERPYEKCEKLGVKALSDAELLAVLLRTGTKGENVIELARKLLNLSGVNTGLLGLMHVSKEELMRINGIGRVKAIQILCLCELSRRISRARKESAIKFNCPDTVADYFMEDMRHCDREELKLILLDSKNNLIKTMTISSGTVNCAPASPREIYVEALKCNAVFILLLHNHPSGDPTPSKDDINITRQLKKAGELVGIRLLDHLVIGDGCFTSIFTYAGI